MKKFVLVFFVAVSQLFSANLAYVYQVGSHDATADPTNPNRWYFESINGSLYQDAVAPEACYPAYWNQIDDQALRPRTCIGYIKKNYPVKYASTQYQHKAGEYAIFVYYPATVVQENTVFIDKRNQYEIKENLNNTTISDGYSRSPYLIDEVTNADGSKQAIYVFQDLSSYFKRITVTICPKHKTPTEDVCAFTVLDIQDVAVYNKP